MEGPVNIVVDQGHLFRYASEVDPTTTKGKGGYLDGIIQLPTTNENLRIVLSTYPDTTLEYDKALVERDPQLLEFHPCALHVIRKKGKYRQNAKEPVPNISMYRQELQVINRVVKIVNKWSEFDTGRNIPAIDDLFTLDSDNCIHLGGKDTELNMVVVKPKIEKRSQEKDISMDKMIADRIHDPNLQHAVGEYFTENSATNKHLNKYRLRIKLEVFSLESGQLLGSCLSGSILDTNHFAMKINDISKFHGCNLGGTKVFMASEFSLPKSIEPLFQLWTNEGERIDEGVESQLLMQPEEISIVRDAIIFITPGQPNFSLIQKNNYIIKLVAKRNPDGFESQAFDFHYQIHNDSQCVKTINDCSFAFQCLCQILGREKLVNVLDVAKPGLKRRSMPTKNTNTKNIRLSTESQTSLASLSPTSSQDSFLTSSIDSGIESSPLSYNGISEAQDLYILNQQDVNGVLGPTHSSTEWSDINPQEELDKYLNSSQQMEVIQKDGLRKPKVNNSRNKPKARNVTEGEAKWNPYKLGFPIILFAVLTFLLFLVSFLCVPDTISHEQFLSLVYSVIFGCLITLISYLFQN